MCRKKQLEGHTVKHNNAVVIGIILGFNWLSSSIFQNAHYKYMQSYFNKKKLNYQENMLKYSHCIDQINKNTIVKFRPADQRCLEKCEGPSKSVNTNITFKEIKVL